MEERNFAIDNECRNEYSSLNIHKEKGFLEHKHQGLVSPNPLGTEKPVKH